jgi:hypothetical protein
LDRDFRSTEEYKDMKRGKVGRRRRTKSERRLRRNSMFIKHIPNYSTLYAAFWDIRGHGAMTQETTT